MSAFKSMNLLHLSTFELRQVCYFLAVVEAGNNFSRAAEFLQIEQPPLSQRIRSLEKKLKVELFDRKRRPLQLTAAGKVFLAEAQIALNHLEQAITQARRASQGEVGHLSIGIASSIANSLLPDILSRFCDRFPNVELELRELTLEQQLQALRDRHLDVGFEAIPMLEQPDDTLEMLPIVQESLVAALPDNHLLTNYAKIPLSALMDYPLILPELGAFPFYQQFIDQCQQAGFQPRIVRTVTATWMLTILSLVAAKMGLAILPSNVLNLQRRGVSYRAIEDVDLVRYISVLWQRDNASPILREFLALVQTVKADVPLETLN